MKQAVLESKVVAGREGVDGVRLRRHALFRYHHPQRGVRGQQAGHLAPVVRVQMLDHHEGQAAALWDRVQQLNQRVQAACRGADADDRSAVLLVLRLVRLAAAAAGAAPPLPLEFGHRRLLGTFAHDPRGSAPAGGEATRIWRANGRTGDAAARRPRSAYTSARDAWSAPTFPSPHPAASVRLDTTPGPGDLSVEGDRARAHGREGGWGRVPASLARAPGVWYLGPVPEWLRSSMAEEIVQTNPVGEGVRSASWGPRPRQPDPSAGLRGAARGADGGLPLARLARPLLLRDRVRPGRGGMVGTGCIPSCPPSRPTPGTCSWLLLGAALAHFPPALCLQLGVLLVGVVWLLAAPGRPSFVILMGYDLFADRGERQAPRRSPARQPHRPHAPHHHRDGRGLPGGGAQPAATPPPAAGRRPPAGRGPVGQEFIGHELVEEDEGEAAPVPAE